MPPTELTQSIATRKLALRIASTSTSFNAKTLSICFWLYVLSSVYLPMWSTSAYSNASASAIRSTSLPSAAFRNSPRSLSNFKAFHCLGLWLAVRIIPPHAPSIVTANSVVGVEANPMFTTSNPIPINVPHTTFFTISPEIRASRPTTILLLFTLLVLRISVA